MKNVQTFTSQIHLPLAESYSVEDIKCVCKEYCKNFSWVVSFSEIELIFPNGSVPGIVVAAMVSCPLDVGMNHTMELAKSIMRVIPIPDIKIIYPDETIILERSDL